MKSYAAAPENGKTISNPQIVHGYTKTVTVNYAKSAYPTLSCIPESIVYSEYDIGTWFNGTLYVRSVVSNGNSWVVVYSGSLVGLL